ncbi:hypothetical protein ACFXQA_07855 [Microbacterium sp. P07]|uniref:hypothetical protein n=1 Tax=Microbacterium sp. P07 TaxID=3366952 RepID=UPI003745966A
MSLLRRLRRPPAATPTAWSDQHAADVFAYEMLALRELEQDAMLWQTPALALAAQAFLLTIALNPEVTVWGQLIAASLGIVIAAVSMQLMAKHRQLAAIDRTLLAQLEVRLGIPAISSRRFAPRRGDEAPASTWWRRLPSYVLWQFALGTFVIANAAAVVLAFVP